ERAVKNLRYLSLGPARVRDGGGVVWRELDCRAGYLPDRASMCWAPRRRGARDGTRVKAFDPEAVLDRGMLLAGDRAMRRPQCQAWSRCWGSGEAVCMPCSVT